MAATAVGATMTWLAHQGLDPFTAPAWLWVSVVEAVVIVFASIGLWRSVRWISRGALAGSVAVAVLGVALMGNVWVHYLPTVGSAVDVAVGKGPVHETSLVRVHAMKQRASVLSQGVTFVLPRSSQDPFAARTEYVYVPPAWFADGTGPTDVFLMMGGVINTPRDWIVSGGAIDTANNYARTHGGRAPIMVFVDTTGGLSNDTECVNGPRGQAETHIVAGVPQRLHSALGATGATGPLRFVPVGWSMGGTCAITLAARHPHLFERFVAISPDRAPNSGGNTAATVRGLYGGKYSELASHDPVAIFSGAATAPRFRHVKALLAAACTQRPCASAPESKSVTALATAAQRGGVSVTTLYQPGRHNWSFAAAVFRNVLPWLSSGPARNAGK
ncbi:alpha/beta hydrolase [Williamsia maris]|uniref:alpha/beta hydrolase n=1 Tax=Williamsia maris TaxID=72806 RepID=UPI0031DAE4F4